MSKVIEDLHRPFEIGGADADATDGRGNRIDSGGQQNARTLAVDHIAEERDAIPAVAKSVTLEVDTVADEKLV